MVFPDVPSGPEGNRGWFLGFLIISSLETIGGLICFILLGGGGWSTLAIVCGVVGVFCCYRRVFKNDERWRVELSGSASTFLALLFFVLALTS